MSKALTVLAECVDIRSGKRFAKGDVFSPAPHPEQAKRLVKAGCLPEAAIESAVDPETEAEKDAEEKAAQDAADKEALKDRTAAARASKKAAK